MRLKLRHSLRYSFPEPVRSLTQILRLTPRSHEGQRVTNWRIDVDPDCLLKAGEDHFGNLTNTLVVPGLVTELKITAHGEVTSFDASGIVRGSAERLPVELYLRDTSFTIPDEAIRAFTDEVTASSDNSIEKLHLLLAATHQTIAFDAGAAALTAAADAFKAKSGKSQDFAQIFTACTRHLDLPARCVTGYYLTEDGSALRHAWAEAFVHGLGWVGFDPVHDICPQDNHVRVAIGLDAVEAAAARGTRIDGCVEDVTVTWLLARSPDRQTQEQQQQR